MFAPRFALPALMLAALAVFPLAGCSSKDSDSKSSDSASPSSASKDGKASSPAKKSADNKEWVKGLCVAVNSYVADLEKLGDGFDPNVDDAKKMKASFVAFLEDATGRTRQLKSDIDKLGSPSVKDGDKIESDMSKAAQGVVTIFEGAVKDAKKIDDTTALTVVQGLGTVSASLDTASADIEAAFSKIDEDHDTTGLGKLAADIPECATLF